MSDPTGVFTFSNEGRARLVKRVKFTSLLIFFVRNCSLTTLMFPAKFEVLGLSIGAKVTKRKEDREAEIGISSQVSNHYLNHHSITLHISF
jgi:hypothetical protein